MLVGLYQLGRREGTLGSRHPQLRDAQSGDIIDFYGPCDENPTGKDQVIEQRSYEERTSPVSTSRS